MSIVRAAQMAEIDRRTQEEYHIPALVLMEQAGHALWKQFQKLARPSSPSSTPPRLLMVAGAGNNGGDALVMARLAFQSGWPVEVIALRLPSDEPAATQFAICQALAIPIYSWERQPAMAAKLLKQGDWIVDGINGTGLRSPLRSEYHSLIEKINHSPAQRCAIDIPSGLYYGFRPQDLAVTADCTLTVELPKLALFMPPARPYCGKITVVPIGFPAPLLAQYTAATALEDAALSALLPLISPWSHKQQRGVVAVAAGAPTTLGAALLAADGAAAAGAGLLHLVMEPAQHPLVHQARPSYIVQDSAQWRASSTFTMIIGPGWGRSATRTSQLGSYIESGAPGVLDADALHLYRALQKRGNAPPLGGRWVLTPHPGEFAVLAGRSKEQLLPQAATHLLEMAAALDAVVVLKSFTTMIADPSGQLAIYDNPHPALATGGSGDTLAGIIGALMAQGLAPYLAARAGVLLHGVAARRCAQKRGLFLAQHLPTSIAQVLGEMLEGEPAIKSAI